jgi:hypothetical protein
MQEVVYNAGKLMQVTEINDASGILYNAVKEIYNAMYTLTLGNVCK